MGHNITSKKGVAKPDVTCAVSGRACNRDCLRRLSVETGK